MPNKAGHQYLTLICSAAALPLGLLTVAPEPSQVVFSPAAWLALEAGILVTLIPEFTPDLDHSARRFNSVGKFLGLKVYSEIVPHRYGLGKTHWTRLRIWQLFFFSHLPGIGTLPRTLILLMPLAIVMLAFTYIPITLLPYIFYLWLGMSLSDTFHVVADLITTDFKQLKREYWQGRKEYGRPSKYPKYKRY